LMISGGNRKPFVQGRSWRLRHGGIRADHQRLDNARDSMGDGRAEQHRGLEMRAAITRRSPRLTSRGPIDSSFKKIKAYDPPASEIGFSVVVSSCVVASSCLASGVSGRERKASPDVWLAGVGAPARAWAPLVPRR